MQNNITKLKLKKSLQKQIKHNTIKITKVIHKKKKHNKSNFKSGVTITVLNLQKQSNIIRL
jgi:hypothetical protein